MRFQQLYGYWNSNIISSKTYQPPPWATLPELNKALVYKAPWLAAWDSTIRRSMYLESIEDRTTSPLKQLFNQHKSESETIDFTGIQARHDNSRLRYDCLFCSGFVYQQIWIFKNRCSPNFKTISTKLRRFH